MKLKKIVVAPDSFKGSLSASQVADAIEEGIKKVINEVNVVKIPMADGGEGTLNSLVESTNGYYEAVKVKDPLLREINSSIGILGDDETCVIEMALASGICLLKEEEKNPLITTTYGTGQLIKAGLDKGIKNFILAIGGSATNDGGAGMLQALGVRLLDSQLQEVPVGGGHLDKVDQIDVSKMDPRIKDCKFTIASDVSNPFIGPNGASYVFGPQKGATKEMVQQLDQNLTHWANKIEEVTTIAVHEVKGAGAAGGLGGAFLAFFPSSLQRGIDIVIEYTKLEKEVKTADLVITGEGKIDFQTKSGKTPMGVAQVSKKYQVPTIAIAGTVGSGIEELYDIGIDAMFSLTDGPMNLSYAMNHAYQLITKQTEQMIRLYQLNNN